MTLSTRSVSLNAPRVGGDLPGPRSAELLARQGRRESNARTYPRHLPIAIAEASGSFVTDVDGNESTPAPARKSIKWAPGAHTGTLRGNQLAFAAGTAAVHVIRRDDVLGNVGRRGEQVADRLTELAHTTPSDAR